MALEDLITPATVQAVLRAMGADGAGVDGVLEALGVSDPYTTLGGRYDNSQRPYPGGLYVPGGSPAQPQGSPALPYVGHELVAWDAKRPPRGKAIRIWATPQTNYGLTDDIPVGAANSLSIEILAIVTGFGGASTTRRFVVNTGMEAVIEVGGYERGVILVVAASNAFLVAPTTDPLGQGSANFTWISSEDQLANATEQKLVSRIFQTNIDPQTATRIVVPPGGIGWKPFGLAHVAPVDFAWPITALPTTLGRAGGGIPLNTFPPPPIGEVIPVRGAKYLDLLAPVGWPFTFIQHQFELAPL